MDATVERLLSSLLYEGYALYPYTPGATKNATPTPFGIVYPPAYAGESSAAFDHLRLECLLDAASADAPLRAQARFLQASGERHQGIERRVELDGPGARTFAFDGLQGRVRLRRDPPADDGLARVAVCVHNTTPAPVGLDRAGALARALISTHVVVEAPGARFVSPLEPQAGARCQSVNTFAVLASAADDAVLGAAIVLPDHPRLAPESRADLFDNTEIEEALVLHVQALSDGERAAIAQQDPAVREMIARADAVTQDELLALHGRVELRDPVTTSPDQLTPPHVPGFNPDGERRVELDGVTYERGARVRLWPGRDASIHDRMLHGRTATIERIYHDVDGKLYLAVTVDGDPGQQLLRETNRFLFFFAPEVEVLP